MQIRGHRLTQRQDAIGSGIAMMAIANRLDRGFGNMGRCRKIRLADAQRDDIAALCLKACARARTAKAFSSPIRSKFGTVRMVCLP